MFVSIFLWSFFFSLQFAVGGTYYLGGGAMQIIYCPSYTVGVVDVFAGLGSEVFLGGK